MIEVRLSLAVLILLVVGGIYVLGSKQTLSGELVRESANDSEASLIGVISDTHIPARAKAIPLEVFKVFESASYIIHAGDFVQLSVAEELERIAPVVGVHGNMDPSSVREMYPEINSLEVLGWRIGVVHDGILLLRGSRLKALAEREGFDVLIFGHSHRGSVREDGGVLYVNPGSPTQPLFSKASVAVLKVSKGKIKAEIVVLEDYKK